MEFMLKPFLSVLKRAHPTGHHGQGQHPGLDVEKLQHDTLPERDIELCGIGLRQ